MKKVEVHWLDHSSYTDQGWYHTDSWKNLKPMVVKTTGYILEENKQYIKIGLCLGNQGQVSGIICIIKKCIVKRKNLK